MNHHDHVRATDYYQLSDFEKESLFKLIKEKHGLPVVDVNKRAEYIFFSVFSGKPRLSSTTTTYGYPLLSLEELRGYVAMGMLL